MTILSPPTFDYVCAHLICPVCSQRSSDPCAIDLQTKLARDPALRHLKIDDRLDIFEDPREAGYLRTSDTLKTNVLRVVETWSCPHCGANFLWAHLTFKNNVLCAVEVTNLTEDSLEETDFVTSEVLILVPIESNLYIKALAPAELRAKLAKIEAERDR